MRLRRRVCFLIAKERCPDRLDGFLRPRSLQLEATPREKIQDVISFTTGYPYRSRFYSKEGENEATFNIAGRRVVDGAPIELQYRRLSCQGNASGTACKLSRVFPEQTPSKIRKEKWMCRMLVFMGPNEKRESPSFQVQFPRQTSISRKRNICAKNLC